MKIYKAIFTSQSTINELPNSQTIFGAICSILYQTQGDDALNEYINSFTTSAKFVHSSMFLNNTFPMIKKSLFSLDDVNKIVKASENSKKLEVLEATKKYKKISSVSQKVFETYITEGKMSDLKNALLTHSEKFLLNNAILSFKEENILSDVSSNVMTRNGFSDNGVDKTLFYTKNIYYPKETEFCIYVKSNMSIEYLKNILRFFEYFGIGNRRSVGMNCFRLKSIEETMLDSSKENKVLLSRYIPNGNEIDFDFSYYQLSNDIYRSSKAYNGGLVNGKYIHILEGSWLKTIEDKEYYGRIMETENNGKIVYHYAIGFMV